METTWSILKSRPWPETFCNFYKLCGLISHKLIVFCRSSLLKFSWYLYSRDSLKILMICRMSCFFSSPHPIQKNWACMSEIRFNSTPWYIYIHSYVCKHTHTCIWQDWNAWVMSHMWIIHTLHVNESRHTREQLRHVWFICISF